MKAFDAVGERRQAQANIAAAVADVRFRLEPHREAHSEACSKVETALEHKHYEDALAVLDALCEATTSASLRLAKCGLSNVLAQAAPKAAAPQPA